MIWAIFPTTHDKEAPAPLSEGCVKEFLRRYDRDGDGRISRQELKLAFKSQGLYFAGRRARKAIRYADANGDGYISDQELNELLQYASSEWGFKVVN
ncbi:hypothetical protein NMG60_11016421 [Bertholletia excelsa]